MSDLCSYFSLLVTTATREVNFFHIFPKHTVATAEDQTCALL